MRRNGARFALISVDKRDHQTLLLRLSTVLRNAVVMCRPLITPVNCWHKTTWPEFQSSLPPGQVVAPEPRKGGRPRGEMRQRILTLLGEHPEGLSAEQIRAYIQPGKPLGDTLQGMRKQQKVTTRGTGKDLRYFVA